MIGTHEQNSMWGSAPVSNADSSKPQVDSDPEERPSTVTRFPPILRSKPQEIELGPVERDLTPCKQQSSRKEEGSAEGQPPRRPQGNFAIKKKAGKKKTSLPEIKAETVERYRQYLQFLSLVNLSNNVQVRQTDKSNYRLVVGKGNNSSLIKSLFRTHRPWWTVLESTHDAQASLSWHQLRQNQLLNDFRDNPKTESDLEHIDFYLDESDKAALALLRQAKAGEAAKEQGEASQVAPSSSFSMRSTFQMRSQSVTQKDIKSSSKLRTTKRSSSKTRGGVSGERLPSMQPVLSGIRRALKVEAGEEEGVVRKKKPLADPKMWPVYHNYRKLFGNKEMRQLKRLKVISEEGRLSVPVRRSKQTVYDNRSSQLRMHNHLTHNWNLSNKKALFLNLKIYYEALKVNPFDYIPMTFHVTDLASKEFTLFEEEYERRAAALKEAEKRQKNPQAKHPPGKTVKRRNAWLVKPGENTNQGVGIQVVESLEEVREVVGRERVDKMGRGRTHIIQEYIYPFLYQKRKFDIRSYMLVTSLNGQVKGYWYQDGYIRTACKEFNMKNLGNKFVHLTNDAVQKHHEDYGKHQPANKISYADFQRYLDAAVNTPEGPKLRFHHHAYPEMKKIAADTVRAVYGKMNPLKKDFTFEVFGLDFMIDESFKVWLIEVNTNPCLEMSCPLLTRLIPSMLEHTFKLAVDPLFPPPSLETLLALSKKAALPESPLENCKYELIFDEVEEGRELRSLLLSAPQVMIEEAEEEEEYDDLFEDVPEREVKDERLLAEEPPSCKAES